MTVPCASIGRYRGRIAPDPDAYWLPVSGWSISTPDEVGTITRVRFVEWLPYRRRKVLLREYYRGLSDEQWIGEEPPDELVNLWKEDALQHEGDRV